MLFPIHEHFGVYIPGCSGHVIPAQAGIPAFAGRTEKSHSGVIPAQAGIPAFAGMTRSINGD
jgi:hypothetical protein